MREKRQALGGTMEGKWYPYGITDIRHGGIRLSTVARVLEFIPVHQLAGHGTILKVINCEGLDILQFEDGSFSVPIERTGSLDVEFIRPEQLYRLGILDEEHLKEIQAEEDTIEEEEARDRKERMKTDLVMKARIRMSEEPGKRLEEIREIVSREFQSLSIKNFSSYANEARSLNAQLSRIEDLPLEQLLTPEELEQYYAM